MSTPSAAELKTQLQNIVAYYEKILDAAQEDGTNLVGLQDTLEQALESDDSARVLGGIEGTRGNIAAALDSAAPTLEAWMDAYIRHIVGETPAAGVEGKFETLRRHFIATPERILSRVFVFGSPAAGGGNVGNGVLNRLTVGEDGEDIENQHADAKVARCVQDEHTGATRHEEVFEFRSEPGGRDALQVGQSGRGSGLVARIPAKSARQSLLLNPSFSQFTGTLAVPTAITNWTVGSIGNFQLSESVTYRDFLGDPTPRSVQFDADDSLTQTLRTNNRKLDRNRPYYAQIAINRNGTGADGTITLDVGASTASVVLSTLGGTGWNILRITVGQGNWPKAMSQSDFDFKITLSGGATFGALVDDALFVPYDQFDGAWYAPVGGSTEFLIEDSFSWSDTETGAKIQKWFWRAFNRYLPADTGTPVTINDPA